MRRALALCFAAGDNGGAAVLDPAKVAGKIVVCDRGVNARVDKSLAVQEAGGIGMVLINTSAELGQRRPALRADRFTCRIADPRCDQRRTRAAARRDGDDRASTLVFNAPAPITAAFSSRGPLAAGGGDLLKPDVMAPGQDILARSRRPATGVATSTCSAERRCRLRTSRASAALLKQKFPSWSPMAVKSALMTSGLPTSVDRHRTRTRRSSSARVQGTCGRTAPPIPGLVFDHGINDWLAFLCGTTTGVSPATCTAL